MRRVRGFTIIELAISVAVVALIAVGVLVPLVTQVSQRKISETERVLEQAKEALMGYAAATGRLPCPALPDTDGFEKFSTVPVGNLANGLCATFIGFLPAATLGFTPIDTQGYAIDAWGTRFNRIRYAVSNQTLTPPGGTAVLNPFTRTDGMREATSSALATADLLIVCSTGMNAAPATPACRSAAETLTRNAPAVIWSVGANAPTGGVSVDEAQNPNPNSGSAPQATDTIYVSRSHTTLRGSEFDDLVSWLSVGNLVSRMVLAGQLP